MVTMAPDEREVLAESVAIFINQSIRAVSVNKVLVLTHD